MASPALRRANPWKRWGCEINLPRQRDLLKPLAQRSVGQLAANERCRVRVRAASGSVV
jgi:hypothetical protein